MGCVHVELGREFGIQFVNPLPAGFGEMANNLFAVSL
jgi:hypothetical protein